MNVLIRTIITTGRITIQLGRLQAVTGKRMSLRRLAAQAQVPKDLVYRLDSGQARYVDLEALARLCAALHCELQDILVHQHDGSDRRQPV